jgi:hypothetical protein
MKDTEAINTSLISYVLAIPLCHLNSLTFSTIMRGHSENKHDDCMNKRLVLVNTKNRSTRLYGANRIACDAYSHIPACFKAHFCSFLN